MREKFGKVLTLVLGHRMPIRGDSPHEGSDIVIPTGLLRPNYWFYQSTYQLLPPGEGKPHLILATVFSEEVLTRVVTTFILEKTVMSVMPPGEICPFPRDIALDSLPMASLAMYRKKCRQWHSVLEGY